MGHTNRHYHYFFRLLSRQSHLYTEMIPSSQILRAYKRARQIYSKNSSTSLPRHYSEHELIHPDEILDVAERLKSDPAREYQPLPNEREDQFLTLHQLIGTSTDEGPLILQLGGRDPITLGAAAAIGSAFASFTSVNLNCGCPSNAVAGGSGGCALMKDPDTVARCVEQMNVQTTVLSRLANTNCPGISVKHRLGVRNAATYDAQADREKDDSEANDECSLFVKTVSLGGAIFKFQVHARLGLLGEFPDDDNGVDDKRQSLWVPNRTSPNTSAASPGRIKIDHKREQERAKRRARKATIQNRHVPPLRPNIVAQLADTFPSLEFVANGGIESLSQVEQIVNAGLYGARESRIVGAMVGRAAINHPCSFAAADDLWENRHATNDMRPLVTTCQRPSRGQVLNDYIQYCIDEEDRLVNMGASVQAMHDLRRRLIAVPFHLFMGEEGNDAFQRRLKKLKSKTDKMKASSILSGAMSFVPSSTLDKCVDDFVPLEDISKYEEAFKRGSAMQRIVY